MNNEGSLYRKLLRYSEEDYYPFHMPGHKRQGSFVNPFSIDITEIEGFDDLHHARGILKEAQQEAADVYGSDQSWYLVNGSTGGILSAICACTSPGDHLLMARNCHRSAYHGAFLNQLKVSYLYPAYLEGWGISGGISPCQVQQALDRNPDIRVVLIVSPTYEGVISDVGGIADVCHRSGAILIVDEAHGAHLVFSQGFPSSALELGADLVIQSLHKTLPSFTQTALLHAVGERVDREKVERYLDVFQTSSPSYLLMSSIQNCIRYLNSSRGRHQMNRYEEQLEALAAQLEKLGYLRLFQPQKSPVLQTEVFAWDKSKLVLSVAGTNLNGQQLYQRMLEEYHLQAEMAADTYVIFMTSLCDTEQGFERLALALEQIDGQIEGGERTLPLLGDIRTSQVLSWHQAESLPWESVGLTRSLGRICRDYVYIYPPGIPLLVPGERVTDPIAEVADRYRKAGLQVHGIGPNGEIRVVTEEAY